MPPTDTPAIAASPARLLGGVVLLALVVALALLLAWRRARVAAVNEPLARLRGFHIFGPDDGEETVIHVPVLTARPVMRTRAEPRPVAAAVAPRAEPRAAAAALAPRSAPPRAPPRPAGTALAPPAAPRPAAAPPA